jgi:hypothetical protein
MRTRSDADRAELEQFEQQADELVNRHGALAEPLRRAAGLSEDEVAELDKPRFSGDGDNRMPRDSLRGETVEITACFDSYLQLSGGRSICPEHAQVPRLGGRAERRPAWS